MKTTTQFKHNILLLLTLVLKVSTVLAGNSSNLELKCNMMDQRYIDTKFINKVTVACKHDASDNFDEVVYQGEINIKDFLSIQKSVNQMYFSYTVSVLNENKVLFPLDIYEKEYAVVNRLTHKSSGKVIIKKTQPTGEVFKSKVSIDRLISQNGKQIVDEFFSADQTRNIFDLHLLGDGLKQGRSQRVNAYLWGMLADIYNQYGDAIVKKYYEKEYILADYMSAHKRFGYTTVTDISDSLVLHPYAFKFVFEESEGISVQEKLNTFMRTFFTTHSYVDSHDTK